jgi:hypothetical protein
LPERLSDVAGLGSIPELTLMVEDDDVIAKFEVIVGIVHYEISLSILESAVENDDVGKIRYRQ